jgi:solute carrier family 25 uncoupling protein 8/9
MFTGQATSALGCIGAIYRNEGLRGFQKGWSAAYLRLGPQTVLTFIIAERVRAVFGLEGL